MNTQTALLILQRIAEQIDFGHPAAASKGVLKYWERDKAFVVKAQKFLEEGGEQQVRWVVDEMRNLSQGFGSYCLNKGSLDALLDDLYLELASEL